MDDNLGMIELGELEGDASIVADAEQSLITGGKARVQDLADGQAGR